MKNEWIMKNYIFLILIFLYITKNKIKKTTIYDAIHDSIQFNP